MPEPVAPRSKRRESEGAEERTRGHRGRRERGKEWEKGRESVIECE